MNACTPALVAALEAFRAAVGAPVIVANAIAPYSAPDDPNRSPEAILALASIYTKKFRTAVTPV